jgi:hypothetical protein
MASQRQRRAILGVVAAGFIHWAVVADIAGRKCHIANGLEMGSSLLLRARNPLLFKGLRILLYTRRTTHFIQIGRHLALTLARPRLFGGRRIGLCIHDIAMRAQTHDREERRAALG